MHRKDSVVVEYMGSVFCAYDVEYDPPEPQTSEHPYFADEVRYDRLCLVNDICLQDLTALLKSEHIRNIEEKLCEYFRNQS